MVLPVASYAKKRALGKARRAIRKTVPKMKFTGEKPSLFLYIGVTFIALFKDLLDFVGVGSLPAIGTVITICFNILIFLLLTVFDNSGGGSRTNRIEMRGLVIFLVMLVEMFFGLNFVPWETLIMIGLYFFARHAWQKEEKKTKEENRISVQQEREERIQEARQAGVEEQRMQEEAALEQQMAAGQQSADTRRGI